MKQFRTIPWLAASPAVVCILGGIAAMFWPSVMITVLPILIGLIIFALGVFWIMDGIYGRKTVNPLGMPRLLQGSISVIVGSVFLLNRSVSVMFLGVVLGIWAVGAGCYSLRKAYLRRTHKKYLSISALDGVVKLIVGVVMLSHPFASMALWTAAAGALMVFCGVSMLVSAFYLYAIFND